MKKNCWKWSKESGNAKRFSSGTDSNFLPSFSLEGCRPKHFLVVFLSTDNKICKVLSHAMGTWLRRKHFQRTLLYLQKQIPGRQLTITVEVLWTSGYQMHCEKQIQQLNLVVDLLCCPTAEPHQMLMLQWHGPHHVELSRLCLCLVCESVQTWSKLACLRLQLLWR